MALHYTPGTTYKMQFSKLQWLLILTPPGRGDFSWQVMITALRMSWSLTGPGAETLPYTWHWSLHFWLKLCPGQQFHHAMLWLTLMSKQLRELRRIAAARESPFFRWQWSHLEHDPGQLSMRWWSLGLLLRDIMARTKKRQSTTCGAAWGFCYRGSMLQLLGTECPPSLPLKCMVLWSNASIFISSWLCTILALPHNQKCVLNI